MKTKKDWYGVLNSEIESFKQSQMFEITKLPLGKSLIGGKWVHKAKVDADGNSKCKTRYVAKGYTQIEDIDYTEAHTHTHTHTHISERYL